MILPVMNRWAPISSLMLWLSDNHKSPAHVLYPAKWISCCRNQCRMNAKYADTCKSWIQTIHDKWWVFPNHFSIDTWWPTFTTRVQMIHIVLYHWEKFELSRVNQKLILRNLSLHWHTFDFNLCGTDSIKKVHVVYFQQFSF